VSIFLAWVAVGGRATGGGGEGNVGGFVTVVNGQSGPGRLIGT